jgi:hypothetical protein
LKKLHTYFSLALLAIFLFPLAEKQVHAFDHKDEVHCSSAEKHFHDVEHSCSICDYTFTDSNPTASAEISMLRSIQQAEYLPGAEDLFYSDCHSLLPSRAPPEII